MPTLLLFFFFFFSFYPGWAPSVWLGLGLGLKFWLWAFGLVLGPSGLARPVPSLPPSLPASKLPAPGEGNFFLARPRGSSIRRTFSSGCSIVGHLAISSLSVFGAFPSPFVRGPVAEEIKARLLSWALSLSLSQYMRRLGIDRLYISGKH